MTPPVADIGQASLFNLDGKSEAVNEAEILEQLSQEKTTMYAQIQNKPMQEQ